MSVPNYFREKLRKAELGLAGLLIASSTLIPNANALDSVEIKHGALQDTKNVEFENRFVNFWPVLNPGILGQERILRVSDLDYEAEAAKYNFSWNFQDAVSTGTSSLADTAYRWGDVDFTTTRSVTLSVTEIATNDTVSDSAIIRIKDTPQTLGSRIEGDDYSTLAGNPSAATVVDVAPGNYSLVDIIDNLSPNPSGALVLNLQSGVHNISALIDRPNTHILGANMIPGDLVGDDLFTIFDESEITKITGGGISTTLENCTIADLYVYGGSQLNINSNGSIMDRCIFDNNNALSARLGIGDGLENAIIRNCAFWMGKNGNVTGIHINPGGGTTSKSGIEIFNNRFEDVENYSNFLDLGGGIENLGVLSDLTAIEAEASTNKLGNRFYVKYAERAKQPSDGKYFVRYGDLGDGRRTVQDMDDALRVPIADAFPESIYVTKSGNRIARSEYESNLAELKWGDNDLYKRVVKHRLSLRRSDEGITVGDEIVNIDKGEGYVFDITGLITEEPTPTPTPTPGPATATSDGVWKIYE